MDGVFVSYKSLSRLEQGEAMFVKLVYFEMLKKWEDAIILRVTKLSGTIFILRVKNTHNVKVTSSGLVRTVMMKGVR